MTRFSQESSEVGASAGYFRDVDGVVVLASKTYYAIVQKGPLTSSGFNEFIAGAALKRHLLPLLKELNGKARGPRKNYKIVRIR